MTFSFSSKGSWKNTEKWLSKLDEDKEVGSILDSFGREGVNALASASPVDTGELASSWGYSIIREKGKIKLIWTNDNIEGGAQVAILVQYGHGTGTGGYVAGIDYVNPAMRPIFERIADEITKAVT